MKRNSITSVMCVAGLALCQAFSVLTAAAAETVMIDDHTATFVQVREDYPAAGQSTWYYTFTSGRKPAISHVTFALGCPGIMILGAGMWDGENMDKLMYKAGMPEPGTFPGAPKGDPTTGIVGLKFDLGFDDGATRHYYFTVNGNYAPQSMTVAVKAGNGFDTGTLPGPSTCGGTSVATSALGDRVWLDANANGIQDGGEAGVAGVTVRLLSQGGEELATTVTDADGFYLFDGLVDGTYRVRFVRPQGYAFTFQHAGVAVPTGRSALSGVAAEGADSDADPVSGLTGLIDLPPGTAVLSVDAGLVASDAALTLDKAGVFHPGTTDPWAFCTVFGPAHVFNALVFGDLTASGGDTEGRLAVGGDAAILAGYSVGYGIYGREIEEFCGGTEDMFVVAGNLADGPWGVNGNVVHGGERTGVKRVTHNGNFVRKVVPVTFRKDGNVPSDGSGATFDELRARLAERSGRYAALADRGVVSVENSNPYYLTLTAEDPALNVFNLTAEVWGGSGKEIRVIAPEGSTVLINVRGAEAQIVNSTMIVEGTSLEHVLVHYVDATSVATSGFDHNASVLAMQADGAFSGGAINGRAVFGGSVTTTNGFEFHNFHFLGEVCTDGVTPSPPSVSYTFTVVNTGNAVLENVTVSDPLVAVEGGPVTLQPGETNVFTATLVLADEVLAAGVLTNTAEAVATTLLGLSVSASDSHVAEFPGYGDDDDPPGPGEEGNEGWEKADFVVQTVDVTPSPSVAGARFKAVVRIKNEGQKSGDAGLVEFWVNSETYAARPEGEPAAAVAVGVIGVGEPKVVELDNLRAPFETGTYHTLAVVNRAEATDEWSYGNNHGGATYTVEYLTVDVEATGEGMLLTWNSLPGYYYFVERADGLGEPFTDIVDNLPATPPRNAYLDTEAEGGAAFYRVWGYRP